MIILQEEDMMAAALPTTTDFRSRTTLRVPSLDIVSFALEHLDELDPEKPIYVNANNPSDRVLAGDVHSKIERLAAGLVAQGMKAGDCVCIHSFNTIWYPLLWLAVIAAGGIVSGSNPSYTSSELAHHFKITDTKFVITQAECVATVKEAMLESDVLMSDLLVLGTNTISTLAGLPVLNGLWNHKPRERIQFNDEERQSKTTAVYATTSGTTGLPKAAEISHRYLVAQVTIIEQVFLKRTEEIRQLVCLPVFHAFAAQLAIVLPLRLGISTYFMPRFNLETYLNHVQRFQITDLAVVPPIISALTSHPSITLDTIRYILCAGAPMTASVQSKLYSSLNPAATVSQCWGLTELGWITCFDPTERDETGSVGRLLPNTHLKIVDENENPVITDNIHGEARIKSASMMSRYRNNFEANAMAFDKDGYYCTGDCVYMQNGKVFIAGRIKDILKVNGWQVSPEELEKVVLELATVSDCAVVGHTVTNDNTGLEETKPKAFVVRESDSLVTAKDIENHVASRLVRYKRLSGGVVFVDRIPRSNTGKILRRKLLEPKSEGIIRAHQGLHEHVADHAKQSIGKSKYKHINGDILNHHYQHTESASWSQCVFMSVLFPLCFALGLPGLILLCVAVRQILLGRQA